MKMLKLFHYLKITLSILLAVAILNDIGAFLYVVIVGHDTTDFPYVTAEVLAFLLAILLIYKNQFFGNILAIILAAWSLNTALAINSQTLISWGLLKVGPQVVFSNMLMLAILLIGILHLILLIHLKLNKGLNGK